MAQFQFGTTEWHESRDLSISKEGQARYIGSPNLEDTLL